MKIETMHTQKHNTTQQSDLERDTRNKNRQQIEEQKSAKNFFKHKKSMKILFVSENWTVGWN